MFNEKGFDRGGDAQPGELPCRKSDYDERQQEDGKPAADDPDTEGSELLFEPALVV